MFLLSLLCSVHLITSAINESKMCHVDMYNTYRYGEHTSEPSLSCVDFGSSPNLYTVWQ